MVRSWLIITTLAFSVVTLLSQSQTFYSGNNVTGQLTLARTVNALAQAQLDAQQAAAHGVSVQARASAAVPTPNFPKFPTLPHPALTTRFGTASAGVSATATAPAAVTSHLTLVPNVYGARFNALTQAQQRNANGGNQFNVEPPSPQIAVANGFVLEGVNNAIQVYNTSGKALLPAVLATNELFGVAPAIDRSTGFNGVYPTDLRVFYDPDINRWFVLQRSQDNDPAGNPISLSHLYVAVSQTGDPTGTYNIYVADTTNTGNPGCPCLEDYLQVGADQYGFYISADEYDTSAFPGFVDATIWAISKASLQSGAHAPTAYRFTLPALTGYEFAVQPATTPPHASYFLASGGLEYFVSSVFTSSVANSIAVWAMTNTSSLATPSPTPQLRQITVPTLTYSFPDVAVQPDGYRPLGGSAPVPFIDGGDIRVQSVSYAGGRLYVTIATSVDVKVGALNGCAYIVLSPVLRSNVLNASVLMQDYLVVDGASVLRPAVAVTDQGQGAIAATLVGPKRFASAMFIPIDGPLVTPTKLDIAAGGGLPEDGFTGYIGDTAPVARWGDYSGAVIAADGSTWMVTEYISTLPRSQYGNWDTLIVQKPAP